MPCIAALVEKTNLSLLQDDFMKSSKNAKCKVGWKTEMYLNNALAHGFHCASYPHTNERETLFNVQCTGGSSAHEEPPRAA